MLFVLRIIFGAALAWCIAGAMRNAEENPHTGDIANAGYLALCIIIGIANAIVWAPFFGGKISDAMTGAMNEANYVDKKNYVLRSIYWLQGRGHQRLATLLCFLEGVRHPHLPAAFVIGMKNAKAGSWLEKVYAKEVFRFDNAQNCIDAYHLLRGHGIDPRPHTNPQVTLALQGIDREVLPDPEKLTVPKADVPTLQRNPKIRLFGGADKTKSNPPA